MQKDATLLDVTFCVSLHILLNVVAQSLKPVKLLATCKRMQQLRKMLGVVASVVRGSVNEPIFHLPFVTLKSNVQ